MSENVGVTENAGVPENAVEVRNDDKAENNDKAQNDNKAKDDDKGENDLQAKWSAAQSGRMLVDCDGDKIGKLQDVYVDVETDEPQFATVKEGFIGRHLTFVPLGGIHVGP